MYDFDDMDNDFHKRPLLQVGNKTWFSYPPLFDPFTLSVKNLSQLFEDRLGLYLFITVLYTENP